MANTTNYNWETPDDTDLVKDGAAAIRTLGNSIDTTTKNLNPETTTGDIAYRSATANTNTRLAIGSTGQVLTVAAGVPSWATPTVGDITEVQAGTGISVASGTGPIPVITNTVATAFDAAGDLVYGTGADTFSKLAIGTAGQVLKVNSGATAPEWAAPAAGGFVGCSLYASANITVANDSSPIITWNSERFDTDAFHSTSSDTSRITIPSGKGGKYLVIVSGAYASNSTGFRAFYLRKNGSGDIELIQTPPVSGSGIIFGASTIIDLVATDYIEITTNQTSGGNLNFQGGITVNQFAVQYLGA